MKFQAVPLSEAKGKIAGHNIAGPDGKRLLRKGKPLTDEDIDSLRTLGRSSVYVAELEPEDVDENNAARRVALAVCGPGLHISGAASGRANLLADGMGLLRIDVDRLAQINELDGITLATVVSHFPVHAKQIVATVKIIPYAVPESTVREVEHIANPVRGVPISKEADGANPVRGVPISKEADGANRDPGNLGRDVGSPIVRVDALPFRSVGLILSGSTSLRARLVQDFSPLQDRIGHLGSSVARTDFVALDDESDEATLAQMLQQQIDSGIQMIVLAGETAIMDSHDIVPRAVVRAGGHVESVGAPVDPGNLLMLAYINDVPVVGAPGCARSRKVNIVDWILPRLLAGDRLIRRDIIQLGHGGLLQDVPERGMPREIGKEVADQHTESEQTSVIS